MELIDKLHHSLAIINEKSLHFQSGGLEEYITVKEVPWIISLLLGVIMQHKSVFDRYLRNWRNENEKTSAKRKNDLSANIVKDASNGIMLSRALMKLRDFSLYG